MADFLNDSDKKKELFAFLSRKKADSEFSSQKDVIVTCGQQVHMKGSEHSILEVIMRKRTRGKLAANLCRAAIKYRDLRVQHFSVPVPKDTLNYKDCQL